MNDIKKKITIGIIAFIGFITTIKLAIIYFNANFNPYALSSFCTINEFIDCDGVAKTTESQFLGVPLALWGMIFYLFVIWMLFADKLKNIKLFKFMEVFKHPFAYIAVLGFVSFAISMTLLGVSLFGIKKLCILCAFTYILNLIIALVAVAGEGFVNVFKQSITDFIDALKIKSYAIAFIVFAILAGGGLTYAATTNILAPHVKEHNKVKEFVDVKTNKYAVKGNVLGKENAKVIVHTYSDYRCPVCKPYDIMIHKLAKETDIKVVHHNLPLDKECNKYLKEEFHHGSCRMAQYALAAERQGKFWELHNLLYTKQPESVLEILKLAEGLNLDLDKLKKDADSPEVMKEIKADIDESYKLGINATPTTVINGKIEVGFREYDFMKKWVKDEAAK